MDDKTNSPMNTVYDFVQLGDGLADTMIRAAEEQVNRARQILDQTMAMADIIRTQVAAQSKQIEEMQTRFKAFGEQMLDAHRKLNGEVVAPDLSPAERAAVLIVAGPRPASPKRLPRVGDADWLTAGDLDIDVEKPDGKA